MPIKPPKEHKLIPRVVSLNVATCPRCGGNHEKLEFRSFELGDRNYTHWAYCPASAEPLMVDLRSGGVAGKLQTKFVAEWMPAGKNASIPPNPKYPDGIDVVPKGIPDGAETCKLELKYPAPGVGVWKIACSECGLRTMVTAAGRPDDPKSIILPCRKAQIKRPLTDQGPEELMNDPFETPESKPPFQQ